MPIGVGDGGRPMFCRGRSFFFFFFFFNDSSRHCRVTRKQYTAADVAEMSMREKTEMGRQREKE